MSGSGNKRMSKNIYNPCFHVAFSQMSGEGWIQSITQIHIQLQTVICLRKRNIFGIYKKEL